jgi:hypothetical protein
MVLFVVAWMHVKCYFLISENHREFKKKRRERFNGHLKKPVGGNLIALKGTAIKAIEQEPPHVQRKLLE